MEVMELVKWGIGIVLASTALFTFVQFLITRNDKKKDNKEAIEKRLYKLEKDSVRMQLLFLIRMMPGETQEIMTCAQHYFEELDGNWFLTPIFFKWMQENKVAKPAWFKGVTNSND